jgi:hypothetical protein
MWGSLLWLVSIMVLLSIEVLRNFALAWLAVVQPRSAVAGAAANVKIYYGSYNVIKISSRYPVYCMLICVVRLWSTMTSSILARHGVYLFLFM